MTQYNQQHSTWQAAHDAKLRVNSIWAKYFRVGGNLGAFELDAYLHGIYPLPLAERNMIALALDELIDDLPQRGQANPYHPQKAEFVHEPPQE